MAIAFEDDDVCYTAVLMTKHFLFDGLFVLVCSLILQLTSRPSPLSLS